MWQSQSFSKFGSNLEFGTKVELTWHNKDNYLALLKDKWSLKFGKIWDINTCTVSNQAILSWDYILHMQDSEFRSVHSWYKIMKNRNGLSSHLTHVPSPEFHLLRLKKYFPQNLLRHLCLKPWCQEAKVQKWNYLLHTRMPTTCTRWQIDNCSHVC